MHNSNPSNVIPAEPMAAPIQNINSVDATIGQPMIDRVLARKLELETLLAALPRSSPAISSRSHRSSWPT